MSKELTEKWKDETLKGGFYWLKVDVGGGEYIDIVEYDEDSKDFVRYYNDYIKEVIAPVPSYEEYKELVFKANMPKNPVGDMLMCYDVEREKEVVKKIQEQLKEANEILMMPDNIKYHDEVVEILNNYMRKWGVK